MRLNFMVNTKFTQQSLRYKMSYKQLTTERKCPKIEFENYTYTVKRKNEKTQTTTWRCTDRQCKGAGKTKIILNGLSKNFDFV